MTTQQFQREPDRDERVTEKSARERVTWPFHGDYLLETRSKIENAQCKMSIEPRVVRFCRVQQKAEQERQMTICLMD